MWTPAYLQAPDGLPSQDLEAVKEIAQAIEEYRQNVNPPPEI